MMRPYGGQPVWGRARWEDEAVRETWRASLVEPLGAPQAVLGMAETGWRKKGQPRRAWRGNIVGRQGGWRPASLGCCWPLPVARALPCWTGPSLAQRLDA